MARFNPKFGCPVCGLPNKEIYKTEALEGDPRKWRCPGCGSVLYGLGRVWSVVGT